MTQTTNSQTVTEPRNFFQNAYRTELVDLLRQKAEAGELESILDGDTIEGYILTGIDETARTRTASEYAWRQDVASLEEALEQPECYEGIDFVKIVADAREIKQVYGLTVDIETAVNIQSKVADWSGAGNEIFQGDSLASPYAEGFYDNCVLCWIEGGYDEDEVQETVKQALAELAEVYGDEDAENDIADEHNQQFEDEAQDIEDRERMGYPGS